MRQQPGLQYLYNVARDMMGKTQAWELIARGLPVEAASFRRALRADVEQHLRHWSAERLGVLMSLGRGAGEVRVYPEKAAEEDSETLTRFGIPHRTSILDAGFHDYVSEQMSGNRLLLSLATLAVVAAMLDLAHNNNKKVVRKTEDARVAFASEGFECVSAR